ncbi:hypothetical protein AMECASPLE_000362 [Ameca splendens]|uniref:Secreted protein n=1 Tax=Ameca splendens TaxID=208324 RepID=A0ABV0YJR6_9TELE
MVDLLLITAIMCPPGSRCMFSHVFCASAASGLVAFSNKLKRSTVTETCALSLVWPTTQGYKWLTVIPANVLFFVSFLFFIHNVNSVCRSEKSSNSLASCLNHLLFEHVGFMCVWMCVTI